MGFDRRWHDVDGRPGPQRARRAAPTPAGDPLDAQLDPQVLVEIIRDSAGAMIDCRFIEGESGGVTSSGVPETNWQGRRFARPGLLGEIDYERPAARRSRRPRLQR